MSREQMELAVVLKELERARGGTHKIELLEQAYTLADRQGESKLAVALRIGYLELVIADHPEKAIAVFNQCLRDYDAHAEELKDLKHDVMWYYKWVVSHLADFPEISGAAIEKAMADMSRRYAAWGYNLRAVHGIRAAMYLQMGRLDEARQQQALHQGVARDDSADCAACELDSQVGFLVETGRAEEALAAAEPILRGSMRCKEVPGLTYCQLMVPVLQRGAVALAAKYQRKSRVLFKECHSQFVQLGRHLQMCALTDQDREAARIMARYLGGAMVHKSAFQRLHFLLGMRLYLLRAKQRQVGSLLVQLPAVAGCPTGNGQVNVGELLNWVTAECAKVGGKLDARNGNRHHQAELAGQEELLGHVKPLGFWTRLFHR